MPSDQLESLIQTSSEVRRRARQRSVAAADRSPAGSVLRLQALAGNAAVASLLRGDGGRLLARQPATVANQASTTPVANQASAAPHTPPAPPTPQSIGEALKQISVSTTTTTVKTLEPWEIFRLLTANTPRKKTLYKELEHAWKALEEAQRRRDNQHKKTAAAHHAAELGVARAQKRVDAAIAALKDFILSDNDLLRRLNSEERTLRKSLARAQAGLTALRRRKHPNATKVKESEDAVNKLQAELAAIPARRQKLNEEVKAKLDQTSFAPEAVTRTVYSIAVEGETVRLSDRVDAWATKFENGLVEADRAVKTKLDDVLAASSLSESNKKILRAISDNESGGAPWSSVNTYDRAVLTWGLVQWTGGSHSDLTAALNTIKTVAPDAFAQRFQKYGIDIVGDQLVITSADGSTVTGDDAALKIQGSPTLSAVMSRAGLDSQIQVAEVAAAAEQQITRPLRSTFEVHGANGNKAKLSFSQVLTSELAAGLFADRVVNAGAPSTKDQVKKVVQAFLTKHKLDPKDVDTWAPDVQDALIAALGPYANRVTPFNKRGCSKVPGSYKF